MGIRFLLRLNNNNSNRSNSNSIWRLRVDLRARGLLRVGKVGVGGVDLRVGGVEDLRVGMDLLQVARVVEGGEL